MLLSELCFSKTVMEISLIRSKFCDLNISCDANLSVATTYERMPGL